MDHSQLDKSPPQQNFIPPPPPPIATLNLAPPKVNQNSYQLHHERKHQRMINGEEQFCNQKEEIQAKCKKQFDNAQNHSLQAQSTGDKIQRNYDLSQKCSKCGHWIQKAEMKLHLSFHVAPVFDNLLLGDRHCSQSRKQLFQRNKVTHILNAASQLKNCFESEGIKYLHLKLMDQVGEYVIDQAIRGAQYIDQSLKQGGVVFVHCALGQSRSVSCIIMYLMLFKNMNYDDSLALIRITRPIARPNITYRQNLQEYYQQKLNKK